VSIDPRVGTEIAGYRIERLLGRGGMGVVYLAEHAGLRRKAALKVLPLDLASDEVFRRRFIRESQLAASIEHPNIIQIYDASEFDGVLYIAMRYVEGSDLSALIKSEGALEFARTISILTQVGDALDAAHAEGLVHRDVKPANILIAAAAGRDQVFLSDFGLTKRGASESHLTSSGEVLGTIDYMAPEQIEGKPVDGRADLYSLGCVAYECLTGHKPFVREAEAAVLWAHVMAPAPTVSDVRDVPEGADQVVARALAKAPEERFPSCREFVTTLRDELPETEGAMPAFVRARRRRRGLARIVRSWPARAVAASLAVALGLGLFFALRPSPKPLDLTALANVVAALDPGSGSLRQAIEVGAGPSAVAVDGATVWVANKDDGTVEKVDSKNGAADSVGTTTRPTGLAVGEGHAWVLGGFPTSVVYSFGLRTGGQGARIDLRTHSEDIAVGEGSVWVTDLDNRALLKIDPRSHATKPIATGGIPTGVAVGQGSVWVTVDGGSKNELLRIDPGTDGITHRIALKDRANSVAVGDESVWVTNGDDSSLTRIDPATNRAKDTIAVGREPVDLSVGGGAVWVANQRQEAVSRVDPVTGESRTMPLGLSPSAVAVASDAVWVTANTNLATFTSALCPSEIPVNEPTTCGYLTVPERHTDPGGRTIQIWVVDIKTAVKNPPPDPVVVLGNDLGRHAEYSSAQPLPQRTGRNVLNVDLRGVGLSKPSLACPEVERVKSRLLGMRLRDPTATNDFLGAVSRCHDRLVSEGIDLGAYNVEEAAADMEDLRRALGIERWNLRALGYTSRVGFEEMREYPRGIRAAWFDSPEYPQGNYFDEAVAGTKAALDALASVCKADASCDERFPDLSGTFGKAVAKLNAHPITITVKDRFLTKGKPLDVIVDGDVLVRQVRNDLATTGSIPLLPARIHAALHGKFGSGADSMAGGLVSGPVLCTGFRSQCQSTIKFSLGAALSMLCHDEAPFANARSLASAEPIYREDFGRNPYLQACRTWNVGKASSVIHTPLRSSIPVLIIHGQFDPYYPFVTAEDGARTLSRSFVYEGTGLGYNALGGNPCLLAIRNGWIGDPTVEPDVGCLGDLPKTVTGGFATRVGSF
jgi:YVTN family beta-propeller protein